MEQDKEIVVKTEFSKELGVKNDTEENHDCTDFPKRPCRQCGKMGRRDGAIWVEVG